MAERHANTPEWTASRGLTRAAVTLIVRSVVAIPIWAALLWVATPLLALFPLGGRWGGGLAGIAIVLAIPGLALGQWMGHKLTEIAGCVSVLLSGLALLVTVGVIWSGVTISGALRPLPQDGHELYIGIVMSIFSGAWLARLHVLDG